MGKRWKPVFFIFSFSTIKHPLSFSASCSESEKRADGTVAPVIHCRRVSSGFIFSLTAKGDAGQDA